MSMIWVCLANVVGTWEIEYYPVFCGFKHQEWGQHSEIISKISTVSGGFNMSCSEGDQPGGKSWTDGPSERNFSEYSQNLGYVQGDTNKK